MRRSLRIALEETGHHPWRTLLVCQGMVWAVALVMVPAAILQGTRKVAVERAGALGTDRIEVTSDGTGGAAFALRETDLKALQEALPDGSRVTALRTLYVEAPGTPERRLWLLGCDPGLPATRGIRILVGRFPDCSTDHVAGTPGRVEIGEVEIALEARLAASLAADEAVDSLLGQVLHLDGADGPTPRIYRSIHRSSTGGGRRGKPVDLIAMRVVGIVEDESASKVDQFGNDENSMFAQDLVNLARLFGIIAPERPWLRMGLGIYLPRQLVKGENIDWIYIRTDPTRVNETSDAISAALVSRGRLPLIYTNTLWSIFTKPELDGYLALHDAFAGIFLGTGLLVLTNVLLLSGRRRRKEIALRRAEGATRGDVFRQFLWEGVLIGVCGLVVGCIVSMLLAWLRVSLDPSVVATFTWPWDEALRAGVVLVTGALLASTYPAWRASGHTPMALFRKVL